MGIRLEWEIEADKRSLHNAGEDPDAARKRRSVRFRLILTVFVLLAVLGGTGLFVAYRLHESESLIRQMLQDTVMTEVTALRLGNRRAFEEAQYSADPNWLPEQRTLFEEYERLLLRNADIQLTGHVVEYEIDDPRARVHVEEIIDGVPYERVWFYWRYETDENGDGIADGWRHVPPDYTFWGEEQTYQRGNVSIRYFGVDHDFAIALADRLDEWITVACPALNCDSVPQIRIEVLPDGIPRLQWANDGSWTLYVLSPYVNRARSDMPFEPELQIETASLLAERLVQQIYTMQPTFPSDAYYIRQAVISWLVGRFVLINTNSFMIESLAQNYGEGAVGQLLRVLQQNSSISILSQLTQTSLDQSNIDWRDFFTWRLALENDLIIRRDQQNFLNLYATREEAIRNLALTRYDNLIGGQPVVSSVQPTAPALDGSPQLLATVQITQNDVIEQQEVVFRLQDNIWLRAS